MLLSLDYELTSDIETYKNSKKFKINYNNTRILKEEFFIPAHDLLFQTTIQSQFIQIKQYQGLSAFFCLENDTADLPFDILAVSFYLLSRYEEYLDFPKDAHDRFSAIHSIAYQANFLAQPLINQWAKVVGNLLNIKYPSLILKHPSYRYLPTYDIDMAWAFRHKSWYRNIGAYCKDVFLRQWTVANARIRTQLGLMQDPFFSFDYIKGLQQKYNKTAVFFLLLGKYGDYDKNTSVTNIHFQYLIQQLNQDFTLALHPSYASNTNIKQLIIEATHFQNITKKSVLASRQHFLKLQFPDTYRNLLQLGIRADYSMGYADAIGFRASIATPFNWYDLKKEQSTDLMLYPFQLMDVTLKDYLNLNPADAIEQSSAIIQQTKAVGGTFISLWHNSSFSDLHGWKGWRNVYESIFKEALE